MTRRRDPHSFTVVRLPERDLAETIFEFASPAIARLGPAPSLEDEREAIALAVAFWNASVLASKRWTYPRVKELNELRTRMRGRHSAPGDAALFDLLSEHWRAHWLDPRLVASWTYDADGAGVRRLACTMGLPDRVEAEVPPPIDKRIAIGGRFLDEVRIACGANTSLVFPADRHRGVIAEDGTLTLHAMMPSALQLFAEGRLPRIGADPIVIGVGGRELGPMILAQVGCAGEDLRHDIAVLVFKPVPA
jgi:hypothetical protein